MQWRVEVLTEVFKNLYPQEKPKSILDIGGGQGEIKDIVKPEKYLNANARLYDAQAEANPDIECDLNKIEKLDVASNSMDLVVLSHILEHLNYDAQFRIIAEAKRISRKHVLVGLPNELAYNQRMRILMGKSTIGVSEFGHHYMFNVPLADEFVTSRFSPEFKIAKTFNVVRGPLRYLPFSKHLPKLNRNFFCYEVYYLLEKQSR